MNTHNTQHTRKRFTRSTSTAHAIVLSSNDEDRSTGVAFFAGILGYIAAIPASLLMISALGIL